MISFIITCLVIIGLSMMLGMFPSFILAIVLEMKGLGTYVYALTILVASIIELTKFISYVFCDSNIKLNIKDIFKMIKSLFNRKNKETRKVINKPKTKSITLNTIEVLVIIGFVIYAIFVPTHSLLASLIYKNVIIRILSIIFIPLVICNIINSAREDISAIGLGFFLDLIFSLFIGFIVAPCIMFTADVWHKDISEFIQSWYTYDDRRFDEIRKKDDFKGEFEYLKSSYENTYNQLINTCDINEPVCLEKMNTNIFKNTNIREYGYTITSNFRYNDETNYICVLDKKTKKYKFYKITYKDFSFELSSQEEFENLKKEKR